MKALRKRKAFFMPITLKHRLPDIITHSLGICLRYTKLIPDSYLLCIIWDNTTKIIDT